MAKLIQIQASSPGSRSASQGVAMKRTNELRTQAHSDQFRRQRETQITLSQRNFAGKWLETFRRSRRRHDPMLVLNMSIFNFAGGWNRTFNQPKIYENVT